LERLAKVILYGMLATTVPFYNISTVSSRKLKEPHAKVRRAA